MKRSSIQKLLRVHREVKDFKVDRNELQLLIEEVLIAECSEAELKSNTSVSYK